MANEKETKPNGKAKTNPYDIDDAAQQTLGELVRGITPERKKTLMGIVERIRGDIDAARGNGASWEEIAREFNSNLNTKVKGNTLSQAYAAIKKRVEESRKGKPSYEELEAENQKLKKEIAKLQEQKQGKK